MPVILREVNVVTLTANPNLLAGSTFEFQRGNVYLSLGIAAAATGTFVTVISGSDIIVEESSPPVLTRYPIIPDEMYFNDVATLADRLVVSCRNPTGGDIIVRVVVQITNL